MVETIKATKKKILLALNKSITNKKCGLLLSGGIDSSLLAKILKEKNTPFTCFFTYVKNTTQAKDLEYVKKVAKDLNLKLILIPIDKKKIEQNLLKIITIIKTTNPVDIGIAIPLFFSVKKAKELNIDLIYSGFGADELFAGYNRFTIKNHLTETKKCLEELNEKNIFRNELISKYFSVKIKYPYLNKQIIDHALLLDTKFLISNTQNKIILREIAKDLGLSKEIYERKKLAMQYGSGVDKTLDILTKENKYKTKTNYLNSFLKVGVLFSGGKDSCVSLWLSQNKGYNVSCLITMLPKNKDSYMFQKSNRDLVKLQEKSLGIPLIFGKTKGEKEKELNDLKNTIKCAKEKFNISGIAVGTIESNYQKDRIEKICKSLNLILITPLWKMNGKDEIDFLLKNKFKIMICKISAYGLNEKHLGLVLDNKNILEFLKLSEKYKFNIIGEGGDFETIVLDAPNFKQIINIEHFEKKMQNDLCGEIIIKKTKLIKK